MNAFFQILNSLSPSRVKKFEKYLKRIYRPNTIPLKINGYYMNLVKKKKESPDLEIAYRKIFKTVPKSKKELTKLRNGLSDLFLEIKEFLILEKFKMKSFERDILWMEILDENDLYHKRKLYEEKVLTQIENNEANNIWYPLN